MTVGLPRAVALLVLAVGIGAVAPAAAQDTRQLMNRIESLQREVGDLQRRVYGQETAPATSGPVTVAPGGTAAGTGPDAAFAARAEVRIQQLETEVRNVTGRLEELDYSIRQLSDRLEKLVGDVDYRLRALEEGTPPGTAGPSDGVRPAAPTSASPTAPPAARSPAGGAPLPGAEPPRALGQLSQSDVERLSGDGAKAPGSGQQTAPAAAVAGSVLPAGSAVDQYKFAFDRLTKRDYPMAQAAFEEFLERHPDDPLSGNAAYWLGETHYARGNFADAAVAFASGYQNYPASSKTADNLLKLALSLRKLDRTEDACLALARLGEEFPNASRSIKRRAESEAKLLQCPA